MKEQKNDRKVGKKFAIKFAKIDVLVHYKKKKKDVNSKEDVLQEKKIRQCSIIIKEAYTLTRQVDLPI